MGNQMSNRRVAANGKVILSDGSIHEYDTPLTVAELMLEYPQQVVVEFHSATVATKPSPLPADKKLDRDKVYIMLPVKRGKPASLSSEQTRQLLFRANAMLKSSSFLASTTGVLPFFAKICPAGNWDGNVQFVEKKKKEKLGEKREEMTLEEKDDFFSQILEERPDFLSRELSGKGWKPSLDTIKEKTIKPKVRHWLF